MKKQINKQQLLDNLYAQFNDFSVIPCDTSGASRFVPGHGNPNAKIMIIGEAPGKQEDLDGKPFIGRSGKLLRATLEKCGLSSDDLFISNTVKCRPPNNRTPLPKEIAFYKEHALNQEIAIVKPKILLTLGSVAFKALIESKEKISSARGNIHLYNKIPLIPTYHPAYILRNKKMLDFLEEDILTAIKIAKK